MMLFKKMVRDEWVKLVAFTVLMSAMSIGQALLWPIIEKLLPAFVENIPDPLKGLFGSMVSEGFIYYNITQQFMKNVGFFGTALAVLLGAAAVARETEAGTLELLLAQPISRARVLCEKYFFNAAFLAIPVMLSSLLVYPAALIIGADIDPLALLVAGFYSLVVVLSIYSFTFFLGILIDEQMQVVAWGISLSILMSLLAVFEQTRYFSVYGYIYPDSLRPIFVAGSFPAVEMVGFVVLSLGMLALSLLVFARKTI